MSVEGSNFDVETGEPEFEHAPNIATARSVIREAEVARVALEQRVREQEAALDALADLERQLEQYKAVAEKPWSFNRGTLRERLEWCKAQHAYHAAHPPEAPPTREDKADFDRACVQWYDEMIGQLDALDAALRGGERDRLLAQLEEV